MCAGGTGRDGGEVRAARAITHRDEARCDIGDEHRNEEGANPLRSALEHDLRLFLEGCDPSDTTPNDHPDTVAVDLVELLLQPSLFHRLLGDGECELCEAIGPPDLLPLQDRKSTRLNSSHVAISY